MMFVRAHIGSLLINKENMDVVCNIVKPLSLSYGNFDIEEYTMFHEKAMKELEAIGEFKLIDEYVKRYKKFLEEE
jgi:hypothetical protein